MPAAKRRPPSRLGRASALLFKTFLILIALSLFWVAIYAVIPPPITATMIADPAGATRAWRPLSAIDPNMARAAIAAEDSRFCAHDGFDERAILQAFVANQRGGRVRGGSTISQQTAKNAFLWQGGGFFRKGMEGWFTLLIEQIWGKRRIMEIYLNIAETGIGTYGVEAGARRYFRHGADRLTATEAARIAAILPLPKRRGAIAPTGFTRRYGNSIAKRMSVVRRSELDRCLK